MNSSQSLSFVGHCLHGDICLHSEPRAVTEVCAGAASAVSHATQALARGVRVISPDPRTTGNTALAGFQDPL